MKRRVFALLLACAFVFTACGSAEEEKKSRDDEVVEEDEDDVDEEEEVQDSEEVTEPEAEPEATPEAEAEAEPESLIYAPEGYYIFDPDEDYSELYKPEKMLDPQQVYANLEYTPKMFYGYYYLEGGESVEEAFAEQSEYIPIYEDGQERSISLLPCGIKAGPHNLNHMVSQIKEYDWLELYCYQETGRYDSEETYKNLYILLCAYEIEGNTLKLRILDDFNVDKENNRIEYSFSEDTLQYEFSFRGHDLTLSTDGQEVTLYTGFSPYRDYIYFYGENYLSPNSKPIDDIDYFAFLFEDEEPEYNRFYVQNSEGKTVHESICVLEDNGLCTFTVPYEDGTKTYQYVYFYCDDDGIILTDGVNTHYYNDNYRDRNQYSLTNYVTEELTEELEELPDYKLEEMIEKKDDLLQDLEDAFVQEGLAVTVNEETGEMAMDSSILFGGDSAVLTEEGKAFLDKFIKVYVTTLYSEKYIDFIAKTMIEGHTAPLATSTYESGLPLSEERANNVREYCLSVEVDIEKAILEEALEAIGYSNSKPIYDESGNVDLAASRRVSFRFIINLEAIQ